MALRDRLLTPQVARAITSPSGIVLAGAGASAAILAGLPIAAAAGVAAAAWVARVVFSVPRAGRERIDPFALGEPWRHFVREALQAQARYRQAVGAMRPGPLRERLEDIGRRIDTGVRECWRIARHGHALEKGLRALDAGSVQRQLESLDDGADRWADSASASRTADALRAQLSSAERMASVAGEARDRLRLLDARLDESVARAIELSISAGDSGEAQVLGTDVDSLVSELESLRTALEEAGGPRGQAAEG
jgi:hypothetical protein